MALTVGQIRVGLTLDSTQYTRGISDAEHRASALQGVLSHLVSQLSRTGSSFRDISVSAGVLDRSLVNTRSRLVLTGDAGRNLDSALSVVRGTVGVLDGVLKNFLPPWAQLAVRMVEVGTRTEVVNKVVLASALALETLGRVLKQLDLGVVSDLFAKMVTPIEAVRLKVVDFIRVIASLLDMLPNVGDQINRLAQLFLGFGQRLEGMGGVAGKAGQVVTGLGERLSGMAGAATSAQKAATDLAQGVARNATEMTPFTDRARQAGEAIEGLKNRVADSMMEVSKSIPWWEKLRFAKEVLLPLGLKLQERFGGIVESLVKMVPGLGGAEGGLAKMVGAINGVADAVRSGKQRLDEFTETARQVWEKVGPVLEKVGQGFLKMGGAIGSAANAVAVGMGTAVAGVTTYSLANSQAFVLSEQFNSALMQTAKQAGYTTDQINTQITGMKGLGASTDTAQRTVMSLVRAGIDASKAWELYARAEDIAVTTGQTGAEVIERLTYGISRQNLEVLRTAGVNIEGARGLDTYAASIGKTVDQLSAAERQQGYYNMVMEASANVAGVAQEMMDKGVFNWEAIKSPMQDVGNLMGSLLEPVTSAVGRGIYNMARAFSAATSEGGSLRPVVDAIRQVMSQLAEPLAQVATRITEWIKNLDRAEVMNFSRALETIGPALVPIATALAGFAAPQVLSNIPVIGQMFAGMNPIVTGLASGFAGLMLSNQGLRDTFGSLLQSLQPILPVLAEVGGSVLQTLGGALQSVLEAVKPLIPVLSEILVSAVTKLAQSFSQLIEGLAPILPVLVEVAGNLLGALIPAFTELLDAIMPIIPPIAGILMEVMRALAPVIAEVARAFVAIAKAVLPLIPPIVALAAAIALPVLNLLTPILSLVAELFEAISPAISALMEAIEPLIPPMLQLINAVFKVLVPILQLLIPILVLLANIISAILVRAFKLIGPLVEGLATAMVWLAEKIEWVAGIVQRFVEKVVGWFQWLFDKIAGHSILTDLMEAIGAIWGWIYDNTIGRVKDMWDWVVARFNDAKDWVTAILTGVWNFVVWVWDLIKANTLGKVQEMWDQVVEAFTAAKDWVSNILTGVWNFVVWVWDLIKTNTIGKVQEMWDWVVNQFNSAKDWVTAILTSVWNFVVWVWDLIKKNTVDRVKEMWDTVKGWFQGFVNWAVNLLSGHATWIDNLWKGIKNGVIDWVKGLWEGVTSWIQSMVDSVVGKFNDLKKAIRDSLQWVIDKFNSFLDFLFGAKGDEGNFLRKVGIEMDWRIPNLPEAARGGIISSPMYMVGEEHKPESIIPWNPAYRDRAADIWTTTGKALGFLKGFASGGVWFQGNWPMTQGPGGGFSHAGTQAWDYAMPNGTPILLGLPGIVVPGPGGGYGTSLGVNLDQGGSVVLAHLERILKTGHDIGVGEQIATSDNTGFSTGPHLHLEFRGTSLEPGQGGGAAGGAGFSMATVIQKIVDSFVAKYSGDEPGWLKGILKGITSGAGGMFDFVGKIAGWAASKAKSAIRSFVSFLGEVFTAGSGDLNVEGSSAAGYTTREQLGDWMKQIGFSPSGGMDWASKIVGRESGWKLDALGPAWNGDGGSRGLWQIQPGAWPQFDKARLFEGLYNTNAAKIVYEKQGPNAWSTNYDQGGILRRGSWAHNTGGSDEAVLTGTMFSRLVDVLDRLDRSGGGDRALEVHNHYEREGSGEALQDLVLALRMS